MAPAKPGLLLLGVLSYIFYVSGTPATPIVLDEGNWTETLTGEWMVKFHAPWCPACKAMKPAWARVATWMDELNFKVGSIDVTENPQLSGRFLVLALPTIYQCLEHTPCATKARKKDFDLYSIPDPFIVASTVFVVILPTVNYNIFVSFVKDGQFRTYHGTREESDFYTFIKNKRWEEIEPMAWWRAPNTYQMGALGLFFRASMLIRGVHSTITTDYGIPEWGSYIVFAVATIVAGLLLGLCLVCLCDCIFPPQPPPPLPDWIKEEKDEGDVVVDDTKDKKDDEEEKEESEAAKRDDAGDADEGARRRKSAKAD